MPPENKAEYLACLRQRHDQGLAAIKVVIREIGTEGVNLLMGKFKRDLHANHTGVALRGMFAAFALECGLIAVENQNEPTA